MGTHVKWVCPVCKCKPRTVSPNASKCYSCRRNLCYSWRRLCYYLSDSEYFLHRGSLRCHQTGNLTSTSLSVRSSASICLASILSFHLSPRACLSVCLSSWVFSFFLLFMLCKQNHWWSMERAPSGRSRTQAHRRLSAHLWQAADWERDSYYFSPWGYLFTLICNNNLMSLETALYSDAVVTNICTGCIVSSKSTSLYVTYATLHYHLWDSYAMCATSLIVGLTETGSHSWRTVTDWYPFADHGHIGFMLKP